jgi:uncharacterized RDD family membrane protein YckC
MQWYYADQGKQAGPVDEARLDELVASGVVREDTLVWCDGMADWQPYRVARPAQPRVILNIPALPTQQGQAETRYCSQCGRPFTTAQLPEQNGLLVCTNCQSSPAATPAKVHYAGFWIRFVARVIDGIILTTASVIIRVPFGLALLGPRPSFGMTPMLLGTMAITSLLSIAMNVAYEAYFVHTRGATLGKMVLGLKIVREDGSGIPLDLAIGRYFAQWVSALIFMIGYIMAGFDPQKRALHDRICKTRVIHVPERA